MIKTLKMLFLVITRIPVITVQAIIVKYRIRKIIKLAKIGYIDKNEAVKTIDRLVFMYNNRNKEFNENVRKHLNEAKNDKACDLGAEGTD